MLLVVIWFQPAQAQDFESQAIDPSPTASVSSTNPVELPAATSISRADGTISLAVASADHRKFFARFREHLQDSGLGVWWKEATFSEVGIWLQDVGLVLSGETSLVGSAAYLQEISQEAKRYVVGEIHLSSQISRMDGIWFRADGISLFGLRIPIQRTPIPSGALLDIDEFRMRRLAVNGRFEPFMDFSTTTLTARALTGDRRVNYEGSVEAITLATKKVPNAAVLEVLAGLGFEDELGGFLELSADVKGSPGRVDLHNIGLTVPELGRFSISAELVSAISSGVREPEAILDIHRAGVTLDVEELSLKSAVIRFEDESLMSRLMAYLGSSYPDEPGAGSFILRLHMEVQFANYLGQPNLEKAVVALREFVADPQSLELRLTAPEPVPITKLLDLASYPALAEKLTVNLVANQ